VVHFSDIEGLGGAEMLDVDADEEKNLKEEDGEKKKWGWLWWNHSASTAY
jgi:hypothetical protein